MALRLGEIAVVSRDLRSGRDTLVSRPAAPRPNQPLDPRSAYNATVSGDGRLVAYESSPGNVNFAKRYGRIGVHLADTARRAHDAHRPPAARRGPLAVGLQPAARRRRAPPRLPGRARRRHRAGLRLRPAHRLAHAGQRRAAARAARDRDLDLRAAASRPTGASSPSRPSPAARAAGRARPPRSVVLRDLAAHTSTTVSAGVGGLRLGPDRLGRRPPGRLHGRRARCPSSTCATAPTAAAKALTTPDAGAVVDPQLSADGRVLAYTVVRGARSHVEVRRLDSGAVEQVASAKGSVTDPSLSADGASWPSPPTRPTSRRARPTAAAASSRATCAPARRRSSARPRSRRPPSRRCRRPRRPRRSAR